MNILDKIDPLNIKYIDLLMSDHIMHDIQHAQYCYNSDRSLMFARGEMGFILMSFHDSRNMFIRSDQKDIKKFLDKIRFDINYQINNLYTIQKILWGLVISEDILEKYSSLLNFSDAGISDPYHAPFSHDEYKAHMKDKKPSKLFLDALDKIQKTNLKIPIEGIMHLSFETYKQSQNLFTNPNTPIKPENEFYPKTNHQKIEYVNFLTNWVNS